MVAFFLILFSVSSLISIFLFKKKKLKTVRSTYYLTTIVLISLIMIGSGIFSKATPNEMRCGFPPFIAIPILIFTLTPPALFLQYVLNRLLNVK